jgi:hypothetical protein
MISCNYLDNVAARAASLVSASRRRHPQITGTNHVFSGDKEIAPNAFFCSKTDHGADSPIWLITTSERLSASCEMLSQLRILKIFDSTRLSSSGYPGSGAIFGVGLKCAAYRTFPPGRYTP